MHGCRTLRVQTEPPSVIRPDGYRAGTPHASTVTYLTVTVPIRTDDGFPRRPYEKKDMSPDSPGLNVCVIGGGWGRLGSDDDHDDILGTSGDGTGDKEKEKETRRVGTCLWMMVRQTRILVQEVSGDSREVLWFPPDDFVVDRITLKEGCGCES